MKVVHRVCSVRNPTALIGVGQVVNGDTLDIYSFNPEDRNTVIEETAIVEDVQANCYDNPLTGKTEIVIKIIANKKKEATNAPD